MLHSLRQRLQQMAEREAAGESFWTLAFSDRVRGRLRHVVTRGIRLSRSTGIDGLFTRARQLILEQEGVLWLTEYASGSKADFDAYFDQCQGGMFPTVVESLLVVFGDIEDYENGVGYDPVALTAVFAHDVNEIFAQERVGWEIIDGLMVEIHSKELHASVVEPALRLLHREAFADAETAYRDALEELSGGKPKDAITDAGAALQATLTTLGCEGNALGDLIKSARKKRLLADHDTPLTDVIERALHWVSADRSEMGDVHKVTEATPEDAWFTVHMVGAIIVRLASGVPRK